MRFLMKVQWDMAAGNELARAGKIGETVGAILEDLQPEAAYFTAVGGNRGGYLVVNVDDPAEIPALAEPWFLAVNATFELFPLMTPEDLERAGPAIEQAVSKFG